MPKHPLQSWLDRADELSSKGEYFEAHEELEAGWMAAEGGEKILLQGLIQIAAGLHRLRLKPEKPDGALYLLERGSQKLSKESARLTPQSLPPLLDAVEKIRAVRAAPASMKFGLRAAGG